MSEDLPLLIGPYFVESIEVELPYEGGVVSVLKVAGEDLLG